MAENLDPKKIQQETDEVLNAAQDKLVSWAADLNTKMRDALRMTGDEVDQEVFKKIQGSTRRAFEGVESEIKKAVTLNDKLRRGQLDSNKLQVEKFRLEDKISVLENQMNQARRYGIELEEEEIIAYQSLKEELQGIYNTQEDLSEQLNKRVAGLTGILERVGKVPFLKDIVNANEATRMMKEELVAGGSSVNALGKGFQGLFKGISKGTVVLAAIGAAVKALKFVVSLFVQANSQAVDLAKNINTTVASADAMRSRFRDIRRESGQTYNNVSNLIGAMQELVAATGVQRRITEDILKNQTFLTKRVGATAEEATNLNMMFQAFGVNATEAVDKMLALSKAFADTEGIGISINTVLQDINSAGAEIAGYFGFSTEELTKAVISTRRLGVNLNQASSIASKLLDFESSISAELEAELLTGKEFNLNLARTLALQGDIAGATTEVLGQMNSLTKEQRRNPIVMKAMADATGLTVEELNKAFLMQSDLNLQAQEYEKIVRSGSKADKKAFLERYGIDEGLREQIERRISVENQYQEVLTDVKQMLVGLVEGGTLQILTDSLVKFANVLSRISTDGIMGFLTSSAKAALNPAGTIAGYLGYSKEDLAKKATINSTDSDENSEQNQVNRYAGMQQLNNTSTQTKEIKESTDKQTQVMQELVEQNKQLITAVQTNKDVYIDGNKATSATAMSLYKSN